VGDSRLLGPAVQEATDSVERGGDMDVCMGVNAADDGAILYDGHWGHPFRDCGLVTCLPTGRAVGPRPRYRSRAARTGKVGGCQVEPTSTLSFAGGWGDLHPHCRLLILLQFRARSGQERVPGTLGGLR